VRTSNSISLTNLARNISFKSILFDKQQLSSCSVWEVRTQITNYSF
jgi:hypothetical protein